MERGATETEISSTETDISSTEDDAIPLARQAQLLSLHRSRLYYEARAPRAEELAIKRSLDRWYTERPCLGTRKLVALLAGEGLSVSRHTISRYRQEMGLWTQYAKPKTSLPGGAAHQTYPYLLRGLSIERPNQVWGVDITYIRLREGWMYLVAFLDWFSRFVVAWELSDRLEMPFVLSCANAALQRWTPEIVNSDQGSHFTSERYTGLLQGAGVKVSMDGRGRYVDNIFTERLWRSVKQEEVYLTEYETPRDARAGIGLYLKFYNEVRPHQSLGNLTPSLVHTASERLKTAEL